MTRNMEKFIVQTRRSLILCGGSSNNPNEYQNSDRIVGESIEKKESNRDYGIM